MVDFETEIEAFDVAIKDYQNAIDEIKEIKKSLLDTLEILKTQGWNSKAGEAFFSKFNTDWVENIDLYVKIIELMNQILNEAKNNFADLANEAQSINYEN